MVKKKTITLELPGTDDPEDTRQSAAERAAEYSRETAGMDEDDAEELFKGLDELRTVQGVVFQVYRVEPTEKSGFCTEYPASLFSQIRLTRDYGPGTYRIRVKANGRYVPGGGSLRIATLAEDADPRTAGKGAGEKSSVSDLLDILKADREKSSEKLLQWTSALAPLLSPVLANFFSGKSQVTELVSALGALQGLQPKPDKPLDFNSQLENIAQLMGKLKELAGDEKTTTGATWIDLIRDAISGVKPILEQVAGRALGGMPNRGAIPMMVQPIPVQLPGPAPAVVGAPVTPPTGANGGGVAQGSTVEKDATMPAAGPVGVISLLPWLSATLQQLIVQAARNRDPELYAEVTLDNMPEGVDPKQLIPFLERPDWWAQLQTFSPQVAPYPAWFADYREAVLAILKEDAVQVPEVVPHPAVDPSQQHDPERGDFGGGEDM